MTLFVTGANGLVGSFICKVLIAQGYTVKALKRAQSDLSLLSTVQDQIVWFECDLHDPMLLSNHLKGVEGIIH